MTLFLQGCTSYVIDKARGNHHFFPSEVRSACFDAAKKEFNLCVIDSSDPQQEGRGHFTVKIPQDLLAKGGSDHFPLRQRSVYEAVKKHSWFGEEYYDNPKVRETIHAYDLSGKFLAFSAEGACNGAPSHSENLEILRAPNDISAEKAILFKGETINGMLARKKPFVVFVPANLIPKKFDAGFVMLSPCQLVYDRSCLLLVTNAQSFGFTEILSITDLTRIVQPEPAWYLLMPFSMALDASIFLLFLGGLGGGCC